MPKMVRLYSCTNQSPPFAGKLTIDTEDLSHSFSRLKDNQMPLKTPYSEIAIKAYSLQVGDNEHLTPLDSKRGLIKLLYNLNNSFIKMILSKIEPAGVSRKWGGI